MRFRVAFAACLTLAAVGVQPILPARAEIDASGTRLSVAGSPFRFYMTYGHIADTELYAPVMQVLRRANITFQREGDDYLVYIRGVKKATWPIVTSRDDVPETGEPCVLELGGSTYVPVKRLSQMAGLKMTGDKATNQVALLLPTTAPAGPRIGATPQVQPRIAPAKAVVLSNVQIEPKGATLQLTIRTNSAVKPRVMRVNSGPPVLCLDFDRAQWAQGLTLPAAMGDVKAMRVGYPATTTARIAVEVADPTFNITNVRVDRDEVTATISRGIQVRNLTITPDAATDFAIQARMARADNPGSGLPDRQLGAGNLDGSPNIIQPSFPVIPDIEGPDTSPSPDFRPVQNLNGKVIVVDAGHGGHHAGAKGLNYLEKDLCMKMSFQFQRELEERGATVIMTRTSDVFVSLNDRCRIANQSGAHIFVSIHCNSMPRRNMQSGSETYWHSSERSRLLARALHPRLVKAVKGRDGGIRNRSFAVIRETSMPSVLLEIAYINNTQDEILLADGTFHNRLAVSLAQGVMDYFGAAK